MHFRRLVTQYSLPSILPLEPILSQLNRVHINAMSFKIRFDIKRHHAPNLMSGLVSLLILTVFCMHFLTLHVCHITC
jgi:hypothetical protein